MAQKVRELMHRGAETVRPDDTVKQAAIRMEACEVGPLPVCDGDRLVGIITDRDITIRAVATGRDPNRTTVRETMTSERVVFVQEDQDVEQAVELMRKHELRRLPVVDAEKRLVGMLALADIGRHADTRQQGKALEGVSQPSETEGPAR